MSVILFVSCLWMQHKVHATFYMLMLDSKPYFYVDYMIPLLEKVFKLMLMQFYNQPIRGRGLGANERVEFENEPCALYILKAKSFCFDFRVVLASPDHTNPNPIMIWNSFISLSDVLFDVCPVFVGFFVVRFF